MPQRISPMHTPGLSQKLPIPTVVENIDAGRYPPSPHPSTHTHPTSPSPSHFLTQYHRHHPSRRPRASRITQENSRINAGTARIGGVKGSQEAEGGLHGCASGGAAGSAVSGADSGAPADGGHAGALPLTPVHWNQSRCPSQSYTPQSVVPLLTEGMQMPTNSGFEG